MNWRLSEPSAALAHRGPPAIVRIMFESPVHMGNGGSSGISSSVSGAIAIRNRGIGKI